jgi:hypothetical protein
LQQGREVTILGNLARQDRGGNEHVTSQPLMNRNQHAQACAQGRALDGSRRMITLIRPRETLLPRPAVAAELSRTTVPQHDLRAWLRRPVGLPAPDQELMR